MWWKIALGVLAFLVAVAAWVAYLATHFENGR